MSSDVEMQTIVFTMIRSNEEISHKIQLSRHCTHKEIAFHYVQFLKSLTYIVDEKDFGIEINEIV